MRFNPARLPRTQPLQFGRGVVAMAGSIRSAALAPHQAGGSAHNAAPPGAAMV